MTEPIRNRNAYVWKKHVALLWAATLVAGCSSDDPVCDPGATQVCVCVGGEGVQVCNADGNAWGACSCDNPDAGLDSSADAPPQDSSADAPLLDGCVDECTADATQCDERVVQSCLEAASGCLQWVDAVDCALTEMNCDDSGATAMCVGLSGHCSNTGEPCTVGESCTPTEVMGFCITRDDVVGTWRCGYETRLETEETNTCEGNTVGLCESSFDCPAGASCGGYGATWCGAEAMGVCSRQRADGGGVPCANDSECTYTPPLNVCVVCGDGAVHSPQEQCDDGNQLDGDGCDSRCQFEGRCMMGPVPTFCGCATATDCLICTQCAGGGCSCAL